MRLSFFFTAALAVLVTACPQSAATLQFVDFTPANPQLGQTVTVRFVAQDNYGKPQAGIPISFKLQTASEGLTISPTSSVSDKSDGTVLTQLTANSRVSSATVVATSGGASAISPPITFAGTSANARRFTFQCGELSGTASGGIHAIGVYDHGRALIAGVGIKCSVHVADRNGDGVPGASVSFLTEAGAIQPSGTTISDLVGNASVIHVSGYPLPQDVEPGTFTLNPQNDLTHIGQLLAPMWMEPWDWHDNPIRDYALPGNLNEPRRTDPITGKTNNPRDNLVTMIAVTSGEEGFTDLNGNGKWDPGEPFDDQTEPFVDANDNGTYDNGELFIDTNGNGRWDGKNGQWDANTLIWAQERLLWTGIPDDLDFQDQDPVAPTVTVYPSPTIPLYGAVTVSLIFSDPWFNPIAQNLAADGCVLLNPNLLYTNVPGNTVPILLPSVKPDSAVGVQGVRFTYPAADVYSLNVADGKSYGATLLGSPALGNWGVPIHCNWTQSPLNGWTYFPTFTIAGTLH